MKQPPQPDVRLPRGLTLRALSLGVVLMVVNAYWLNEAAWGGRTLHVYISLFVNTVFCLFVLVLLNLLLKRALPRYALHNAELFVIYVMLLMVSTLGGNTNMGYLVYYLAHPFWFASAENDWMRLFNPHIPDWIAVRDKDVLRGFYEGESSFFLAQNLYGWLIPVLTWSAFIFVLYFVLICMNVILRRQFSTHERLTYPIAQLPLEMGRNPARFFRNRLMWIGFGFAGGIEIVNGIHFLYPAIPSIPVGQQVLSGMFQEKPWDAVGTVLFSVWPSVVGLAFFLPLDLAFSALFFYFFGKIQLVVCSATGWYTNPYLDEQSQGGWIGLGLLALWISRRHLKGVFTHAAAGKRPGSPSKSAKSEIASSGIDDSSEPMPYRYAVWGMIVGLLFILLFGYKAGASVWTLAMFFSVYFVIAIALTKVRAGLGPPIHEMYRKDPGTIMVAALGTRVIGARDLTILSFFFWLNRVNTAHPMPNQLEAFHIGRQTGINSRRLLMAMLIALAVGVPLTFLTYLQLSYNHGGLGAYHTRLPMAWGFNSLEKRLTFLTDADRFAMTAMGIGFGFTMFLTVMKMRFLWWHLHPIGYVLGTGHWGGDMNFYWFPILVGWFIKTIVLRYGGLRAYRKAIPLFAGLILGDYVIGAIWSIIGITFKIPTYKILIE